MATKAQRAHMLELMKYLLAHEPQIHYGQVRPMRATRISEAQLHTLLRNGHGLTMDCSESVTAICKWAGLHDPNHLGYDGQGYTGTMLDSLPHYTDPHRAQVGALVVFGPGNGDHVAMVMESGQADPYLFSHGQENGPRKLRYSVEHAFHRKPATFLSIAHL